MKYLMNVITVLGGIFSLALIAVITEKLFGERGMKWFMYSMVVLSVIAWVYFVVIHPRSAEFYHELRYFKP